ncbi:MAG: hypothetical protein MUC88_12545 [Planctomycetes bacterium]|jgi:hypothetical protein|nr:hypothetical protein [Planctomycetota bacterium]
MTGLLAGVLASAGCTTRSLHLDSRLPDQPRLVGGGVIIEWKAPEPGTAFLVEKQTGKIVETRTLAADEVFSFAATSVVQADEFEQILGIRFDQAQFLLYFQPASGEDATPETNAAARGWSRP